MGKYTWDTVKLIRGIGILGSHASPRTIRPQRFCWRSYTKNKIIIYTYNDVTNTKSNYKQKWEPQTIKSTKLKQKRMFVSFNGAVTNIFLKENCKIFSFLSTIFTQDTKLQEKSAKTHK